MNKLTVGYHSSWALPYIKCLIVTGSDAFRSLIDRFFSCSLSVVTCISMARLILLKERMAFQTTQAENSNIHCLTTFQCSVLSEVWDVDVIYNLSLRYICFGSFFIKTVYKAHIYIAIIWKNLIDYEEREIHKTKLKIEAQRRKGMPITYTYKRTKKYHHLNIHGMKEKIYDTLLTIREEKENLSSYAWS